MKVVSCVILALITNVFARWQ